MRSFLIDHRLRAAVSILALAAALAPAAPAQALSSSFSFELTTVPVDLIGTGLSPGDPLAGSFSHVDCVNQPSACGEFSTASISESLGHLWDFTIVLDLALGGFAMHSVASANANDIYVRNGPIDDEYEFRLDSYLSSPALTLTPEPTMIGGSEVSFITDSYLTAGLVLRDLDATVFDYGTIPAALPPYALFEEMSFDVSVSLEYQNTAGGTQWANVFQATAVVAPIVPEASTALMLGLGLTASLCAARRRRRT